MLSIIEVESKTPSESQFLVLPKRLYASNELMQNEQEIQEILAGSHPLRDLFKGSFYLGLQDGEPVIRVALFENYHNQQFYLGYFEAINNQQVMDEMMIFLVEQVLERGGTTLIGPVNGSFWNGYRMKLNQFDKLPFSGEPHNLSYYPQLWQQAGFEITDYFTSNFYRQADVRFNPDRLEQRYQQFLYQGIHFMELTRGQFTRALAEIYPLMSELFKTFPLFEPIDFKQFEALFSPLKQIIDPSMIRLAYDREQLIGFVITLPDYGNLVSQSKFKQLTQVFRLRRRAGRYIVMYLGVHPDYLGLGSALVYPIVNNIVNRQAETIAALIHGNKVTKNYVPEMKDDATHYGLYQLDLLKTEN